MTRLCDGGCVTPQELEALLIWVRRVGPMHCRLIDGSELQKRPVVCHRHANTSAHYPHHTGCQSTTVTRHSH